MIKNWYEFIKESVNNGIDYWVDEKDIEYSFIGLKDEGYEIDVYKAVFTEIKDDSNRFYGLEYLDPKNSIISLNNEYYIGFKITITKSNQKTDDLTIDFQSGLKYLEHEGYVIQNVWDDEDEYENTSPDNIHFYRGSIITWIPKTQGKPFTTKLEEMDDDDIYQSSASISIFCHQPEKIEFTSKDLAEIYKWTNYTTDDRNNIYCEVNIEDMAGLMLSRYSSYIDQLINGIDEDNYNSYYYQPEIDDLFRYNLSGTNRILAIKALIKEYGGLESFISYIGDECSDDAYENVKGKSEEEVIEYLLKERFYDTLKTLCKGSEIISDIRETIADWECQAHQDKNGEELEAAFDKIIEKEGIEFTKEWKEGKRYYYKNNPATKNKQKVYYEDLIWYYKLKFEDRWITDYDKALYGQDLGSVFYEWASDCYFDHDLKPYFSDYGDCDDVALNKEIEANLKHYLK